MAIYHFHVGIVKRSSGHSSVAAAAYCSASELYDERKGRIHDYEKKRGVVFTDILLSESAPEWMRERGRLWNAVEAAEKRKDAQLARIIDIALPKELTQEQNINLTCEFVRQQFVSENMIADVNVHYDNSDNPHAHILVTMRKVTLNGFSEKKVRDWNKTDCLLRWREKWAELVNQHLADKNQPARIDHRSHLDRGIHLEPTIHMGRSYNALKYGGKVLDRVQQNQQIIERNALRVSALSEGLRNFGFFGDFVGNARSADEDLDNPFSVLVP